MIEHSFRVISTTWKTGTNGTRNLDQRPIQFSVVNKNR